MNLPEDEDSVFEQALRGDLPSRAQQNRVRQRLLAAGMAAGTALGSANVAAATQASFGASALSKLSALSWPAKLGLTALIAAPVAALPVAYPTVRGAEMVSQVQHSAASVRARSASKALSPAQLLPHAAAEPAQAALEPAPAPESLPSFALPAPAPVAAGNAGNRAPGAALAAAPLAADAPASDVTSNSERAVAAFDSAARGPSTLAAETQLLDRAFAALSAGDRSTAAALVAEHAKLFPNGLLRQERERARARLAADQKGE